MTIRRIVFMIIIFVILISGVMELTGFKSTKKSNPDLNEQEDIQGLKNQNSIVVGVYEPLSGLASSGGLMELRGIEIAHKLYSDINGFPIEMEILDNQSRKDQAVNAVTELIESYHANAIIGSWGSDYAIAAAPIIENSKVPTIGASCSSPQVTMGNQFYSRVCNIDSVQTKAMAKFIINNYSPRKIAIIVDNTNQYSKGLSEYFRESYIEFNGLKSSTIKEYRFKTGDISYKKQLKAIKLLDADAIYVASNYLDGIQFIKDAKDLNVNVPIFGPDTWDTPEFILNGGSSVEGVVISSFYSQYQTNSHEFAKFRKAYLDQYDEEPASFAVLGYDAYLLLYYSIKRSHSIEPELLNRTIQSTVDFEGAAGSMSIDENGDATRPIFIKQVKNSDFRTLNVFEDKN